MNTRMPALLTAGTLALTLTACGGGAPEEEPANEAAATPEEGGGNVLDLVAGLGESTQEIDNYTLDMEMVMPDPDMGEIDMTMTYEVMNDPEATQITMVMPFLGEMLLGLAETTGTGTGLTAEELGTSILIVPAGGEVLVSNHNGLQEVDTPWMRGLQNTDQVNPDDMFDINTLPEVVGAFSEIEQVEETGTEEISGVGTTVIEGTMTSEEIEAMSTEQRSAVDDLMGDVTGTLNVSFWITDDGFPMRIDMADDEADISMVFSSIDETSFEIPSEDEITDI
ncbi:LolA-like protein [Nocardiopsis halotolerans]|uniref:hypothetical protein n=1 Tax=Nocardiopsis halotolerans TaxID=124252 RepID=UPI00047613D0|nr:hypothetical protein [Nocardiopsis halotolerans]